MGPLHQHQRAHPSTVFDLTSVSRRFGPQCQAQPGYQPDPAYVYGLIRQESRFIMDVLAVLRA